MKSLRYVCVQPRLLYYAWQVEVMINNFIKHGINPNNIDILVAWNPNDLTTSVQANVDAWNKLASHYNHVRFFFYQDTRQQPIHYISSIRPNVLKQHFKAHPELESDIIFYHDCDMVFTKSPNWDKFLSDKIWYLSNTNSYINYDYIISKGQDVYDKMCEIMKIDPLIPKIMNSNSGGAQYIMKNVDYLYWEKVETDCQKLYYEITEIMRAITKLNTDWHGLQIWCADMWAVLWNIWLKEKETKNVPELEFCWSSDPIEKLDRTTLLHNAGVTGQNSMGYPAFYKGAYHTGKDPFNDTHLQSVLDHEASQKFGTHYYVTKMMELKNKYKLTY